MTVARRYLPRALQGPGQVKMLGQGDAAECEMDRFPSLDTSCNAPNVDHVWIEPLLPALVSDFSDGTLGLLFKAESICRRVYSLM